MNVKKFRFLFSIYFIVFGIAVTLFSSFVGYELQMVSIDKSMEENAQEVAYIKKEISLRPIIQNMDMLVNSIASNKSLKKFIQNPTTTNKENLQNLIYAITTTDKHVMQARFLDAKGMEVIRVNRDNIDDTPYVVQEENLQDKSKRDYFKNIKGHKSDAMWHSRLDLNIENGKVEVPFRPTIRIGTPIVYDNEFKGVVIINILAIEVLNSISHSTGFEHYVIDKDGYFIVHPHSEYSWSKYTNSNRKIFDDFPLSASQILEHEYKGEDFYAFSLNDVIENIDEAILVLKPKKTYKNELVSNNIKTTLFVLFLSVIISIPLAMYASVVPSKLQKALLASNKKLQRFAEIIDTHVITATTKKNSIIEDVSQAFVRASGYKKEELIGEKMNIIRHKDTPKAVFVDLWSQIEQGKKWHNLIKNRRKDGSTYWLEQNIIPITNDDGEVIEYMSVGEDVTAKKELEYISSMDKLTCIYNRRKLDEIIYHEYNRAKRYATPLSVLLLDIDYFKKINDTYGHQVGDEVLQGIALLLKQSIREIDFVGRFGGEEFMIVCPETKKEHARVLAEKVRQVIESHQFETVLHVTVSIGVSEYINGMSSEQLIKAADNALYDAKAKGRNKVV